MAIAAPLTRATAPIGTRPAGSASGWALYDALLTCLVCAVASGSLLQLGLTTPVWLLCYALLLARLCLVLPAFITCALSVPFTLVFPFAAAVSSLWSATPSATLVASVQLTITAMFGIFIGWRYGLTILVQLIFCLALTVCLLSLLHLATGIFPWPTRSPSGSFIGIFIHKSMLAQQGILLALSAATLVLMGRDGPWGRQGPIWGLMGLIVACITVALSKSITNTVLLLPVLVLFLTLGWRHMRPGWRAFSGLALLSTMALAPLALSISGINPVETLFSVAGKSSTLTGRTILWDIAMQQIRETPILGVGFVSFWRAPEFANARWLTVEAGATDSHAFHNFILENMVAMGVAGVAAIFWFVGGALTRARRAFRQTRALPALFAYVVIVFMAFISLLVPGLIRQHEFHILIVTALGVSAACDVKSAARQGSQEP